MTQLAGGGIDMPSKTTCPLLHSHQIGVEFAFVLITRIGIWHQLA